jgi:hypothetical protein
MKALSETQMDQILEGAGPGSLVFISYLAGRPPTEKAQIEAQRASKEGLARRHALGHLSEVWTTKEGDRVVRIFAQTRDTLQKNGLLTLGAWRTYNPSLGRLLSLEVIHKISPMKEVE